MGQALQLVNMLSPWQWVVLACIPPAILLLYFLKLKRETFTSTVFGNDFAGICYCYCSCYSFCWLF